MELTDEIAIKIAKKYNFAYDENIKEIVFPNNINFRIDDDDFRFMSLVNEDGTKYSCAYEFGITAQTNGKFGFHTTSFKNITTAEEFEENIKNFYSFIELVKPLEKKYAELIKLNKIGGDF